MPLLACRRDDRWSIRSVRRGSVRYCEALYWNGRVFHRDQYYKSAVSTEIDSTCSCLVMDHVFITTRVHHNIFRLAIAMCPFCYVLCQCQCAMCLLCYVLCAPFDTHTHTHTQTHTHRHTHALIGRYHRIPLFLIWTHTPKVPSTTRNGIISRRRFDRCDFQWKNPDFLFKSPDFLIRNLDFLLKNVDFYNETEF